MNLEKLRKIWQVVKQIIEIVLAALAGAAIGSCRNVVDLFASLW